MDRILTSNNVATAICKLVAADALPALLGNLTVGNLVSRYFEPTVAQEFTVDVLHGAGVARPEFILEVRS